MDRPAAAVAIALVVLGWVVIGAPAAPGGLPASGARLTGTVDAIAMDPAGNVYLGMVGDNKILKVEPSGTTTTIAGTGTEGYSGDNGPATKTQLWAPQGLAADGAGNLYIADRGNNRIRRVDPAGIITTVAGIGTEGFSGDGGLARDAMLSHPCAAATDDAGDLYIADTGNSRIRKVDPAGRITTIAGTGVASISGDGGPAIRAHLRRPTGVSIGPGGTVYLSDNENNRIRIVGPTGIITTVAGPDSEHG